jgi:hypothetical protein
MEATYTHFLKRKKHFTFQTVSMSRSASKKMAAAKVCTTSPTACTDRKFHAKQLVFLKSFESMYT